ncbi:MAG TPA: PHB depolymerase family esterase [Phycisphaerales bacterium]|nr:PHB depolymerase family esterase [Phycisphaerales bacterium]
MSMMTSRLVRVVSVLVLLVVTVQAVVAGPFDVGGKPAKAALVTSAEVKPEVETPSSPMLDQLRGVWARLDAKGCLELRATSGGPVVPLPGACERVYVLHLEGERKGGQVEQGTIEVLRDVRGIYYARDLYEQSAGGKAKGTRLNGPKFSRLAMSWAKYRGEYTSDIEVGRWLEVVGVPRESVFAFDRELISERMNGGRGSTLEPSQRKVEDQTFVMRLPKRYDPKSAAGLLVFIKFPPGLDLTFMERAADELGLIVVAPPKFGGNTVSVVERWQVAMDALETACERHLVDPRRVYVTGFSGGGQVATHLWLCFPDVFSGAVATGGMATYEAIPIGNGTAWAASFGRPKAEYLKLAKQQRCVAITGKHDFNQRPVRMIAEFYEREGLNVRVDEYADMGHTEPLPERFADALRWVDGPYRTKREAEVVEAQLRLDQTRGMVDEAARRAALVEVTRVGAWSPAAWGVAAELGVVPAGK